MLGGKAKNIQSYNIKLSESSYHINTEKEK